MSLRTRKSKKQKLNRRKSLKIGGMGNAERVIEESGVNVKKEVSKINKSNPTVPSANRSSAQPPAINPLCNISKGDLVQDNDNKIAYVKEINNGSATLSNSGGEKQISDLAKYEYHDILTSLSTILNFVLTSKGKSETVDKKQTDHINKINKLKTALENITPNNSIVV